MFQPERKLSLKYSPSEPLDHAYSTISYANGPGFSEHYLADKRPQNALSPWKDVRETDYDDKDYRQPAMTPGPDNSETHGGEDVGIFATGKRRTSVRASMSVFHFGAGCNWT